MTTGDCRWSPVSFRIPRNRSCLGLEMSTSSLCVIYPATVWCITTPAHSPDSLRDRLKLGVGEGFQIVDRMRRALVPAADDMLEGLDSKHYVAELQTLSVEVSGDVCVEAVVVTGVNAALDRRLDARDATVLTWGRVEAGVAGNAIPATLRIAGHPAERLGGSLGTCRGAGARDHRWFVRCLRHLLGPGMDPRRTNG